MTAQDLVNAGYTGYQGWGDNEAAADFASTQGAGKGTGNLGASGPGSIPAFNFDYEKAAKDAYGELGPYYLKLLTDAKGDINLAHSRLIEDYATGVRNKTQAANVAQGQQDIAENAGLRRTVNNANARGLYTRSNFDQTAPTPAGPVVAGQPQPQTGGFGIPDQNIQAVEGGYDARTQARNTNLSDFVSLYGPQGVKSQRANVDTATQLERKTDSLDQQQKLEAGNMANTRGQTAYQKYLQTYSGV